MDLQDLKEGDDCPLKFVTACPGTVKGRKASKGVPRINVLAGQFLFGCTCWPQCRFLYDPVTMVARRVPVPQQQQVISKGRVPELQSRQQQSPPPVPPAPQPVKRASTLGGNSDSEKWGRGQAFPDPKGVVPIDRNNPSHLSHFSGKGFNIATVKAKDGKSHPYYYSCSTSNCPARISQSRSYDDKQKTFIIDTHQLMGEHNHDLVTEASAPVVMTHELKASIKKEFQIGRTTPAQIKQALQQQNGDGMGRLPSTRQIGTYVDHLKDERKRDDQSIHRGGRTWSYATIYRNIPGIYMLILIESLLTLVKEHGGCRMLFVDGTWALSPAGTQIVTILAWTSLGFAVPIAYFITDGEKAVSYEWPLLYLRLLGIDPIFVMMDFCFPEWNAVSSVWPNAIIRGCVFHFMQACLRKFVKTNDSGIADGRNDRGGVKWKAVVQILRALYKSKAWPEFKHWLGRLKTLCEQQGRKRFYKYFSDTWIVKHHPSTWSTINLDDSLAQYIVTNNIAELHNLEMKWITFE